VKTSVLIVTYQSEPLIADCLRSVVASDARAEIIVVDNASTDHTLAAVAKFPQVKVIANSDNRGFSEAVNQAAARATGDLFLILNPDTLLCVSSIPRLVAALVRHPELAAVGPISNNAGGMQSVKHWLPNPLESKDPENRERIASFVIHKMGGRIVLTKLLIGFCLMIRRARFETMQGLDERLILGYDDLDLCWRLSQAGLAIGIAIDSFVYHAWHKSFEAGTPALVDAMHEKSLEAFTHKLAKHYGGVEKIPQSMDLWGVDWYTPKVTSTVVELALPAIRTAVCIWVKPSVESRTEACRYSIDAFRQAGVGVQDLLVLDPLGGLASVLSETTDIWSIRNGVTWKDLLERISRWFGACRLVLVEAGNFVNPALFGDAVSGSGPVVGHTNAMHPSQFDLGLPASQFSVRWCLLDLTKSLVSPVVLEWRESWVCKPMPWALALEEAASRVLSQPVLTGKPLLGEELPQQLLRRVQGAKCVGVMGQGQLLDLQNNSVKLADCDILVWRISPIEFPAVHVLLRQLRKSGNKKIILLFDNAFYQSPGGVHTGLSPLDVRRELQLAGLRITATEAWNAAPVVPYNSQYGNALARSEFLPEETLWATAARILVVAEPCSLDARLEKKVSVVLLALNQVEYTRKCIESLQKNCHQELEMILVNNGSTDGTAEYFDSVPGAKVIHNPKNLGVAKGWNQGMALATGDYVLILNNDTIAGPDCIENLVRCAENHPEAGIVVPRSNRIAGPQMVEGFTWNSEDEIPLKAKRIQDQNELACWEFPRLKGFCMLIPRPVVQVVGVFDEQYGFGNFEDDDYSCRVRYAGYTLLVADDSFLFHFGSVSFKDSGIDWNKQMVENMDKFNRKWSRGRQAAIVPGLTKIGSLPSEVEVAFALLRKGQWHEARTKFLHASTLNSIDARSVFGLGLCLIEDGQVKEAFALFCRAIELDPSQEDVGQAILRLLSTNYDAESARDVLQFLHRKYPAVHAFGNDGKSSAPQTEWIAQAETFIEAKRYTEAMAILLDVQARVGENFEICNLLGVVKFQQGVIDEATRWFEKALKFDPANSDALLNYYDALLRLGIPQNAIKHMEYALSLDPSLGEVRIALQEIRANKSSGLQDSNRIIYARESNVAAENMIREGLVEKAREVLQEILVGDENNYRALNNLGLLDWYAQKLDSAFVLFCKAVELNPWYVDAVINLYDCSFLSNRITEFMPWLQKALLANPGVPELEQIQQEIREDRTPERLRSYFRKDAEQSKLREQIKLGQTLLEEQKVDSAVLIFSDILNDYPENVECLNGIGIAAFYREHYDDAYQIFRHAILLSPLDGDCLVNYWDACLKTGRINEGKSVLQNALSIDPNLTAVAKILEEAK